MSLSRFSSLLAVACLAAPSMVYAQTEPPTRQPDRPEHTTPMTKGTANRADTVLASWIVACNNNEIALAQSAQSRATNPQVKQFAQMMVEDHRKFGEQLAKFSTLSPTALGGDRAGADRPGAARTGAGHEGTGAERTGAGHEGTGAERRSDLDERTGRPADASGMRPGFAGGDLDHVALIQELARKHLQSATSALNEKQGAEYDRCYMGMQVMAHMDVLDKLEVFSNHASPELRTVLQSGQTAVRQHLEKAKGIAKQLEGADGTGNK